MIIQNTVITSLYSAKICAITVVCEACDNFFNCPVEFRQVRAEFQPDVNSYSDTWEDCADVCANIPI